MLGGDQLLCNWHLDAQTFINLGNHPCDRFCFHSVPQNRKLNKHFEMIWVYRQVGRLQTLNFK